jgi:hypothetical protein
MNVLSSNHSKFALLEGKTPEYYALFETNAYIERVIVDKKRSKPWICTILHSIRSAGVVNHLDSYLCLLDLN